MISRRIRVRPASPLRPGASYLASLGSGHPWPRSGPIRGPGRVWRRPSMDRRTFGSSLNRTRGTSNIHRYFQPSAHWHIHPGSAANNINYFGIIETRRRSVQPAVKYRFRFPAPF